jgi:hypothetical protein
MTQNSDLCHHFPLVAMFTILHLIKLLRMGRAELLDSLLCLSL